MLGGRPGRRSAFNSATSSSSRCRYSSIRLWISGIAKGEGFSVAAFWKKIILCTASHLASKNLYYCSGLTIRAILLFSHSSESIELVIASACALQPVGISTIFVKNSIPALFLGDVLLHLIKAFARHPDLGLKKIVLVGCLISNINFSGDLISLEKSWEFFRDKAGGEKGLAFRVASLRERVVA